MQTYKKFKLTFKGLPEVAKNLYFSLIKLQPMHCDLFYSFLNLILSCQKIRIKKKPWKRFTVYNMIM